MNTNCQTALSELQEKIFYYFKDQSLLTQALTHSSYVNECLNQEMRDNERLEFLGDAVLDLVVGHMLLAHYRDADEGKLSKLRAALVDERGLYEQAMKLDLGSYLFLGKGEEQGGGRSKPSVLAGGFEALIGAIYLDGGFEAAFKVVSQLFQEDVLKAESLLENLDPKTTLQEITQSLYKSLPDYRVLEESGPPHERVFKVALFLKGRLISTGIGKSKKEAEQEAAREALCWIKEKKLPS